MDPTAISAILQELNLHEDLVANIYNYGSWVYGTNSPASDRDIMIVTRSTKGPLNFTDTYDYLHDFELHKLWNQYDVCVHSVENFEKLLEKNYLLAVECIFLPDEFKLKEQIDFRPIYLEKYHDILRLKQAAFYENSTAIKMFDLDDDSMYTRPRSSKNGQSNIDYLFKNLFHGFRYLDFAEQLIQTKSIHSFKRVSHVLNEMKAMRSDPTSTDESNMEPVLNFIRDKSEEYKSKLDALVPTNIVKGTFEAHITFSSEDNTSNFIERLKKTCENSKYKIIFINLNTRRNEDKLQQIMTSSYHCGEYPSIVKQIEEEAYRHFQHFNIVRIKIEALASNAGIPETDMEKQLFWDNTSTYFEFHYKILVKNIPEENKLKELQNVCQSNYTHHLHLSHNAFQKVDEENFYYMITMRLFDLGRANAFAQNQVIVEYLTSREFPPMKVVREFVVHDSHIELDREWR